MVESFLLSTDLAKVLWSLKDFSTAQVEIFMDAVSWRTSGASSFLFRRPEESLYLVILVQSEPVRRFSEQRRVCLG